MFSINQNKMRCELLKNPFSLNETFKIYQLLNMNFIKKYINRN